MSQTYVGYLELYSTDVPYKEWRNGGRIGLYGAEPSCCQIDLRFHFSETTVRRDNENNRGSETLIS